MDGGIVGTWGHERVLFVETDVCNGLLMELHGLIRFGRQINIIANQLKNKNKRVPFDFRFQSWYNYLKDGCPYRSKDWPLLTASWQSRVLLNCRLQSWTESRWWFGAFWGRNRLSWRWLLREWSWFQKLPYSNDGSRWLNFSFGGQGTQLQNSHPCCAKIIREWRRLQKWTRFWTLKSTIESSVHKSSTNSFSWKLWIRL